ncbi:MAG: 2Fe-2S iron-sulfur cluster-binding protein, partial [Actinomycetota bacterium]|nr:2Fe-2S iron-sulfur cluster-binding protein [Actinomycetota bacterium]
MELRVNGVKVELEEGDSLLEAAVRAGFKVPTLCHHPAVSTQGSCRVCVVEEEGSGSLLTACDTPACEGMSILLDTERVLEARREALRLIFTAHPVHCEVCEAANGCRLKELAAGLGVSGRELPLNQDFRPVVDANPFYHRDLSKCISCGLCVRACHEIQGVGNYEMLGRGAHARPGTVLDTHLEASVCEFCGLCASICPVGALLQKPYLHRGVEDKRVVTVCPYCGVGCSLVLKVRENRIVGVEAGAENSVNGWSLCVKGRYGLDFVDHP